MIKLLKKLSGKDWLFVLISLGLIVFQVFLELRLPDYMANITQLVVTAGSEIKDILTEGAYMLGCALLSLATAFVVTYLATHIGASFSKKLRKEVFESVQDYGEEEIKKFSVASLITRTTNDISQVQMLLAMGLQVIIKAPIMAVWAILKITGKSMEFSVLTGISVAVLLAAIIVIIILVLPRFKIIQTLTDNLNRVIRENLTGIKVVRAFNAETYQEKKFHNANQKLTDTNLYTSRIMAVLSPVMSFVMPALTLAIYYVGSNLIVDAVGMDKLTVFSNMVVFSSYAVQVIASFIMLTMIFIIYPRASVSIKRILEILETKSNIRDNETTIGKEKETGSIRFDNVSFKYPDAEECVLKDINLEIKKGETVAFIGGTGSGKSTLINLIPRFYDATKGEVRVDGIDVKNYKLEDLYNKIGYISQKAILFKGSVKENIKFGKSLTKIDDKKIIEALKVSQADFVFKMEKGINADLSQSGTNVSGGQKQRLSIARAVAKNPEIYIFDDSFSALDYKTDAILRKELKKYTKNATTLIVAQRIGTIMHADKIVVLDEGKIIGVGDHKELLKKCQVYQEIAYSQLSKEELNNA